MVHIMAHSKQKYHKLHSEYIHLADILLSAAEIICDLHPCLTTKCLTWLMKSFVAPEELK